MERFTFINRIDFDHNNHEQSMHIYWDETVNAPISLDSSYIDQNDTFTHPYTGEVINFDEHKEF